MTLLPFLPQDVAVLPGSIISAPCSALDPLALPLHCRVLVIIREVTHQGLDERAARQACASVENPETV
jgi:hypothetical protein